MIQIGLARVCLERREVFLNGQPLQIGGRAFDVLAVLLHAAGKTVLKDEIIRQVWPNRVIEDNNLQVQISTLRKVLGGKNVIQTVSGRGYRLVMHSAPDVASFFAIEGGKEELPAPRGQSELTVFVIDDDPLICSAIGRVLSGSEIRYQLFNSVEEFLSGVHGRGAACILLDVHLPGATGLQFLSNIDQQKLPWPVIIMTGAATVPMAVQAMKLGAIEFLMKPFDDRQLLSIVRTAERLSVSQSERWQAEESVRQKYRSLTPRERDVFSLLGRGLTNRQISLELEISEVTLKVHKKRIFQKAEADSVVQLSDMLRIVESSQGARRQGGAHSF